MFASRVQRIIAKSAGVPSCEYGGTLWYKWVKSLWRFGKRRKRITDRKSGKSWRTHSKLRWRMLSRIAEMRINWLTRPTYLCGLDLNMAYWLNWIVHFLAEKNLKYRNHFSFTPSSSHQTFCFLALFPSLFIWNFPHSVSSHNHLIQCRFQTENLGKIGLGADSRWKMKPISPLLKTWTSRIQQLCIVEWKKKEKKKKTAKKRRGTILLCSSAARGILSDDHQLFLTSPSLLHSSRCFGFCFCWCLSNFTTDIKIESPPTKNAKKPELGWRVYFEFSTH